MAKDEDRYYCVGKQVLRLTDEEPTFANTHVADAASNELAGLICEALNDLERKHRELQS